jgi:hypothetical protein
MSTSNRLARAVDRTRELARQIESEEHPAHGPDAEREQARRLDELTATEQRTVMLLHVLQTFYLALGGFASATLVSLFGAVLAPFGRGGAVITIEILGVLAGIVGVGSLVRGSILLIRETSIAVRVMSERAASVRARARLQ